MNASKQKKKNIDFVEKMEYLYFEFISFELQKNALYAL